MASQVDMMNMNKIVDVIRDKKRASHIDVVMMSGLSISVYEKLRPYVTQLFIHKVRYNKPEKMWEWIEDTKIIPHGDRT